VLRLIGPLRALFGAFATGRRQPPPAVFDEAVADPEPWVSAVARVLRGHVTVNFGRQHVQAEEDFLAATGIFTALGERWGLAIALGGLAMLEGWRGEYAAAAGHYRQAIELATELGTTEDEIVFRLFLTRELWLLGERKVAHAELVRAQRDAERLRLPEVIALGAYTAGDLARLEGRPEAARAALRSVVEQHGPLDMALQIRAQAATGLGYLAAADGDLEAARGWHVKALDVARSSSDAPVIAQALTGLADLALREDAPDRAAELLGASLAVRGTTDRSVLEEERVAADARAVLGEERYDRAYQRGQHVTLDTLATMVALTPGA
jgi:tetratricopeptide (TPR) repeat protein